MHRIQTLDYSFPLSNYPPSFLCRFGLLLTSDSYSQLVRKYRNDGSNTNEATDLDSNASTTDGTKIVRAFYYLQEKLGIKIAATFLKAVREISRFISILPHVLAVFLFIIDDIALLLFLYLACFLRCSFQRNYNGYSIRSSTQQYFSCGQKRVKTKF